jgi:hypothetical protein
VCGFGRGGVLVNVALLPTLARGVTGPAERRRSSGMSPHRPPSPPVPASLCTVGGREADAEEGLTLYGTRHGRAGEAEAALMQAQGIALPEARTQVMQAQGIALPEARTQVMQAQGIALPEARKQVMQAQGIALPEARTQVPARPARCRAGCRAAKRPCRSTDGDPAVEWSTSSSIC